MIHICLYQKKNWCTAVGRIWKYSPVAADNLMTVNLNNTKEIVLHRASARHSLPIPLIRIEQVLSAKLLGVTFCSNLKFDDHAKNVWLSVVNAVIYSGVLKDKVYLQRRLI